MPPPCGSSPPASALFSLEKEQMGVYAQCLQTLKSILANQQKIEIWLGDNAKKSDFIGKNVFATICGDPTRFYLMVDFVKMRLAQLGRRPTLNNIAILATRFFSVNCPTPLHHVCLE